MAMSRGIMTALVAAIDRIVAEHDDGPKTIRLLGGGDAPRVAPFLAGHWQLQADLVLLGMAEYVRVS
jgi:pantothenate kinase type III